MTCSLGLGVVLTARADLLTDVKKSGSLRLATEGGFKPFNYYEGAELKGFEVELTQAIAQKMKLKFTWKIQPFDSLLIGLNQHRYDLVSASHGITPEREQVVEFANPHYCTGGIIVSRPGGPLQLKDLDGKVLAVQVGTTYLNYLQKNKGIKEVKTYPKDHDSLQNLMAGRVDAWVTDRFLALDAVKAHPEAKLQVGDLLFIERIGMALPKGETKLRDAINTALEEVFRDGTYAKLSMKYFHQDIRCKK